MDFSALLYQPCTAWLGTALAGIRFQWMRGAYGSQRAAEPLSDIILKLIVEGTLVCFPLFEWGETWPNIQYLVHLGVNNDVKLETARSSGKSQPSNHHQPTNVKLAGGWEESPIHHPVPFPTTPPPNFKQPPNHPTIQPPNHPTNINPPSSQAGPRSPLSW